MFVLVSFGKPAVSVCQGVTVSNLVCEAVSLIDNMCLFLCRRRCRRLYLYLCVQMTFSQPLPVVFQRFFFFFLVLTDDIYDCQNVSR